MQNYGINHKFKPTSEKVKSLACSFYAYKLDIKNITKLWKGTEIKILVYLLSHTSLSVPSQMHFSLSDMVSLQ